MNTGKRKGYCLQIRKLAALKRDKRHRQEFRFQNLELFRNRFQIVMVEVMFY